MCNGLTVKDSFEVDDLIHYFYNEYIINEQERENLFSLKEKLFSERELSLSEIKEIIRNEAYQV